MPFIPEEKPTHFIAKIQSLCRLIGTFARSLPVIYACNRLFDAIARLFAPVIERTLQRSNSIHACLLAGF